jgi:hypothetical protein
MALAVSGLKSCAAAALFLAAAALLSLAGTPSRTRRVVMLEGEAPVCQHTQGIMQKLNQVAAGRQQQVRASGRLDSKKEELRMFLFNALIQRSLLRADDDDAFYFIVCSWRKINSLPPYTHLGTPSCKQKDTEDDAKEDVRSIMRKHMSACCSLYRCWLQEQLCASLADAEGGDISAHVDTQGIFQLHAVGCSSGVTNVNIYPGFYAAPAMSPCTTIQQPAYDPFEWSKP